jgi:spermidine synthase
MPRYLEHTYPQSRLEVIEIDPAVTEVALDMFGLRPDTGVISYNEDARMKIPRLPYGKYDLVVGDAFNDLSVPYHLTTKEFNEDVADLLNEDGIYVANVVDERQAGRFLRSFASTLKETFDYVYVIRGDSNWDSPTRHTYVIAGSNRPFTANDLNGAANRAGRVSETELMPGTEFALWLKEDPGVILRDDYVPVDNMLAPLYLDSR